MNSSSVAPCSKVANISIRKLPTLTGSLVLQGAFNKFLIKDVTSISVRFMLFELSA